MVALLTVSLVATLASAALWQQRRHVAVESAERDRVQAAWVLTGALDWARLILREDARSNQNNGNGDHLAEPWAIGLAEARLSSFLAADRQQALPDDLDAFLSGRIDDQQALLNFANVVDQGRVSEPDVRRWVRLFDHLGLNTGELLRAVSLWALAAQPRSASADAGANGTPEDATPLVPQRLSQLSWLGFSPQTLQRLAPFVTVLPERTPVNLNTAPPEVLMASVPGMDMAQARRLVDQRARQPLRTLSDAQAWVNGATLSDSAHSTTSRYFRVTARLRLNQRVLEEQALVVRNGLAVRALWRERVVPTPGAEAPAKAPSGAARAALALPTIGRAAG